MESEDIFFFICRVKRHNGSTLNSPRSTLKNNDVRFCSNLVVGALHEAPVRAEAIRAAGCRGRQPLRRGAVRIRRKFALIDNHLQRAVEDASPYDGVRCAKDRL